MLDEQCNAILDIPVAVAAIVDHSVDRRTSSNPLLQYLLMANSLYGTSAIRPTVVNQADMCLIWLLAQDLQEANCLFG
jgi:hypothetical protein